MLQKNIVFSGKKYVLVFFGFFFFTVKHKLFTICKFLQGIAGLPGPIGIDGVPGLPGQKGQKVKLLPTVT